MQVKLLSSLEKCFFDEDINLKNEFKFGSCLKNEVYRFVFCYTEENTDSKLQMKFSVKSELKDCIKVYKVENVPVHMPVYKNHMDENYLRTAPGLFPDVLVPLCGDELMIFPSYNLQSFMIEVNTKGDKPAGKYGIELCVSELDGTPAISDTFTLEIIDMELPKQSLINTQWFYCDCLMDYYNTGEFDDRHFEIIENFARTAAEHGMNMILTPVFTPPLDTLVGGERTTNQLVGVNLENGRYSFDFEKLARWIDMCDRVGIEYLEISHFFTQWGAEHAPKIMAMVDGEYKRIFGWDTDATGEEYREFMKAFIPELLAFLKSKNNADKRTRFHISDEPNKDHLEAYKAARAVVEELLQGYIIMDALSDYSFYETGAVTNPVPATNHIEPFLEHNVPDLWTYYCCSQAVDVSNRFISMPSARNRVIGIQMYKYDIAGFLHWGYNFYNNQYSRNRINPYLITDGEYFAPAGDAFSVYPAPDGTAYASLRLAVFHDAIQDMRAMKLCESLYSKDFVVSLIDEGIEPITFKSYPHEAEWLLNLREKINRAIKEKI